MCVLPPYGLQTAHMKILSGRETGINIPFEGILYHISMFLSRDFSLAGAVDIADFLCLTQFFLDNFL